MPTRHLKKLTEALGDLHLTCDYWDVRIEDTVDTTITVTQGEVVNCSISPSLGAFIRVRRHGFWFFEATTEIDQIKNTLQRLNQMPARLAQSSPFVVEKHPLFDRVQHHDEALYLVPLNEKIQLLEKYEALTRQQPHIVNSTFRYKDTYKIKSFLNSAGTQYEYDFNQAGINGRFTLKQEQNIFSDAIHLYATHFKNLYEKENKIKDYITESAEFLNAPIIEPGKYRVLLSPEVAGVFTHESFGHKSEADFMLGNDEALKEWSLGKKIGADCLSIVDDGGHHATSGYCPVDDEGTPAQKNYLIKNGVLTGRLHSLETAFQLNEKPTGNSRALNFEWEPLVRMTSTYIEPGKKSLDEILKNAEGALFLDGVKHGSGLSTFTIAPSRGYRILKNGQKERVRVTVISGSVFETLKNIEEVSADFTLENNAIGGCGKMEQGPLPVSDGGPFVLIKEMQVS